MAIVDKLVHQVMYKVEAILNFFLVQRAKLKC